MAKHHTESEVFGFITGDFECAWDALAEKRIEVAHNRGNFMFALQVTVLLEWVGRLCESDLTKKAGNDFATELQKIEPMYFTELDHRITIPKFLLIGPDPEKRLLGALWDLIRNGQAHLYHDIIVELTDGKKWILGIGGVNYEQSLSKIAAGRSSSKHLTYEFDHDGDLILKVHPGILFLDICGAVSNAQLLSRGLKINYIPFARGGIGKKTCQFDLKQLESTLERGGHLKV